MLGVDRLVIKRKMARIGDGEFLLPTHATQRWVQPEGVEIENTTSFADCREYRGESTVTYAEEPGPRLVDARNADAVERRLPGGLAFTMELTAPIDSQTAAAGDRFFGKLAEPLRDYRRQLIAPKGAAVKGRILRVDTAYRPSRVVIVVVRPDSVEVKGAEVQLVAVRDVMGRAARSRRVVIPLPLPEETHAGVFRFEGDRFTRKAGFRSDWKTEY
jgi:hypothetical protein